MPQQQSRLSRACKLFTPVPFVDMPSLQSQLPYRTCKLLAQVHSSVSPCSVQGFERAEMKQPTESSPVGGVPVEAV